MFVKRKPDTVMVPGSLVLNGDSQVQLWVGDKHDRNAQRQAEALQTSLRLANVFRFMANTPMLRCNLRVQSVWVERPAPKINKKLRDII